MHTFADSLRQENAMRATRRRIAVVLICVASAFTCEIALAEPLYRFGVPPWQRGQSVDDIRRLYNPLLDYLGRATDAKITIVTARNYEDMVHYFADGRVDFGTISPAPYVSAQRLNPGVKLLLTELSWDPTHTKRIDSYQGMIVTLRARDDINTVEDLRGKRIGFVTEESTSGFVFPSAYLQSIGIDYKNDFRTYAFLGSHPRATDALVAGSVDAAATWDFNLNQAVPKHGDVFKVIFQTAIPNLLIATHPSLPGTVREAIKAALLNVDDEILKGLPTAGYVERPESFYDVIRRITPKASK
jgi:phosphonate transport system substrate-binding protein